MSLRELNSGLENILLLSQGLNLKLSQLKPEIYGLSYKNYYHHFRGLILCGNIEHTFQVELLDLACI